MFVLRNCVDAKTDWHQYRLIHSRGLRNLEHQAFIGLLECRPLEHYCTIRTGTGGEPAITETNFQDGDLINRRPPGASPEDSGFDMAGQLNLWCHELDDFVRRIHYREQHE